MNQTHSVAEKPLAVVSATLTVVKIWSIVNRAALSGIRGAILSSFSLIFSLMTLKEELLGTENYLGL